MSPPFASSAVALRSQETTFSSAAHSQKTFGRNYLIVVGWLCLWIGTKPYRLSPIREDRNGSETSLLWFGSSPSIVSGPKGTTDCTATHSDPPPLLLHAVIQL